MLDVSEKKMCLRIFQLSVRKATQTRHSMRRNGGWGLYALRIDWMLRQIASCIYVGDVCNWH